MKDRGPICRSPLPEGLSTTLVGRWLVADAFRTKEAEGRQISHAVAIADGAPCGKLVVEGESAPSCLTRAFHTPAPEVGVGVVVSPDLTVYRLRGDLFFLHTAPGQESQVAHRVSESSDRSELVSVTDVTHGRAEILVIGPLATDLLSRVCGLDFRDPAFPDLAARQTSVAKTRQLVLRQDRGTLAAYALVGERSLGLYLWETLVEAGAEWGSLPVGRAALAELEVRHMAYRDP
jgi:sarcosine oxidase, subunit alpha